MADFESEWACPVCGESAEVYLRADNLPNIGPTERDGWTIHRDGGDAYYHRE